MKYTRDNPKLVIYYTFFEGLETFTGVVKSLNDTVVYYLNGRFHREDGPAIEYANGYKCWYLNGKCYGANSHFTNEYWIRFVKLELLK